MIATLNYQQDVHVGPEVHLPKKLAYQLSVGARYMFHESSNTDLFVTAWQDFNRRIRWRLRFLIDGQDENKPYDPDYDVRAPSHKQAKALPHFLELGLVKGRRFVYETIAKVPDAEILRHPHRSLQPDVGKIRSFLLDKNYVITGTDKNLGIAVSQRDWIIEKSQDILNDVNNYEVLPHDSAIKILNQKCDAMESLAQEAWAYIDQFEGTVADYMRSLITERGKEHHIPTFYGIPKIHKKPVKMRPIIPCHSAIQNPAAKYVHKKLDPLIKAAPSIIHGTKDLAQKLSKLSINPRHKWYIITGDVVAYYPNIPLQHCLDIVLGQYLNYYWNNIAERNQYLNRKRMEFFNTCLQVANTDLITQFQGVVYKQLNGLAMGVSDSPHLANLYGTYFEELAGVLHHNDIFFYGRYIDDCLAIVYAESEEQAVTLLKDMIQFDNCVITWDCSDSHQPFLDMTLYKDDKNTLQHMPYRKNGNHQERIPWISAHPYDVKRGTFLGEMSRLATLSSTIDSYLAAMRGLVALYIRRGYPADDVHNWLYKNLSKRWESRLSQNDDHERAKVLVLKTQYNLAWNYFNAQKLGDVIFNYWKEWLLRSTLKEFNAEFPAPSEKDAATVADVNFSDSDILNSRLILSRKRTRNFIDLSNLWKRTVLHGIEGQALGDIFARMTRDHSRKRPFPPDDVNTAVVGRAVRPRVDPSSTDDDNDHLPLRIRFPSPTPGSSAWASAPMGSWGRGSRQ